MRGKGATLQSLSPQGELRCVKSVRIRNFSGPYFPAFGINTDQKNFEYRHFSCSARVNQSCSNR